MQSVPLWVVRYKSSSHLGVQLYAHRQLSIKCYIHTGSMCLYTNCLMCNLCSCVSLLLDLSVLLLARDSNCVIVFHNKHIHWYQAMCLYTHSIHTRVDWLIYSCSTRAPVDKMLQWFTRIEKLPSLVLPGKSKQESFLFTITITMRYL